MKRSTVFLFIILFSIYYIGCATQVKLTLPALSKPQLTSYTGPRFRVAVSPFKNLEQAKPLFNQLGFTQVDKALTEMATNILVEAGYVSVLERSLLSGISVNHQIEADAALFDQSTTAKKGKFLGAEYILVGAIEDLEANVSKSELGLKIPHLMNLKTSTTHSSVRLSVRLVHSRTGKILASGIGHGLIKTSGAGLQVNQLSMLGLKARAGFKSSTKTPLGYALHTALYQAIEGLAKKLKTAPWSCRVASVKVPKVFIECGGEHRLKKGMRFEYYTRNGEVKDAQGKVIGYDEQLNGEVILNRVQAKMSIGQHTGKTPPKAGDIVVLKQTL